MTIEVGASSALDRKTRSAAAARGGLRIVDLERLADQVVDEVELRPGRVVHRHRVDQHHGAVARQPPVLIRPGALDLHLPLEARAPAAFARPAPHRALRLALEDLTDAP